MKPDSLSWNEMQAEVVSVEIVNVGLRYQVLVHYKYLLDGVYLNDEYKSRLLASESLAVSYSDAAMQVSCSPERVF